MQINTFYDDLIKTEAAGGALLAMLAEKQRTRLRVDLVDASPVTAVTVSPDVRPVGGTYFIEVTGSDTVSIDGQAEVTVTHDGSTVNENVGGSGLDMVFSTVLAIGQSSEVRVYGDYKFPKVALDMDVNGEGELTRTMYEIDKALGNVLLLKHLSGWYRINPDKARTLLNGDALPTPTRTINYTVTNYDTWSSIEERFGVSWKVIVEANNIQPADLATGLRLVIPTNTEVVSIKDLKVLGSHVGRQAWGRDIKREFSLINGDLKLLNPTRTLLQSICNIVSDEGWRQVSEGFPPDTSFELMADNLRAALVADPRVRVALVKEVSVTGSGVLVEMNIIPIHEQPFTIMYRENLYRTEVTCQCADGDVITISEGGDGGGDSGTDALTVDADTVALYLFNSDTTDETGNHDGAANGSPSFGSESWGNYITLDPNHSQYVSIPYHSDFDLTGGFTIEVLARGAGKNTNSGLVSRNGSESNSHPWKFLIGGTGDLTVGVTSGGTDYQLDYVDGGTFSAAEWYYYVAIFDPSNAFKIYRNSSEIASDTNSIPATIDTTTFNDLWIGVRSTSSTPAQPEFNRAFDGDIALVKISNSVRDSAYISNSYAVLTGMGV